METRAARARLRRTFRYPHDSDSEPEAIDEQGTSITSSDPSNAAEQESLISTLSAQNASQNATFKNVLLAFPVVTMAPYIPLLLRSSTIFLALLSITSLAATTYLLYVLPAGETGIAPLDAWTRADDVSAAAADAAKLLAAQGRKLHHRPPADLFRRRPDPSAGRSPLELYLPYLNAALALVLVLMGYVHGRTGAGSSFAWIGVGNLPAIVYVIVLAAKVVMGAVDPKKELSDLKYSYKGA